MRVGIVGYGVVGKAVEQLFLTEGIRPVIHDPLIGLDAGEALKECEVAFICVPTPSGEYGWLDISIVAEVVTGLDVPLIIIKSTLNPGSTETLVAQTNKAIVFCPEWLGETPKHPKRDMAEHRYVVIGGERAHRKAAISVYQHIYPASISFFECEAAVAEIIKLAENTFLAMKVSTFWMFREICDAYGVDYDLFREGVTLDERIGKSHTFTYDHAPGWSGKCLPKDTLALFTAARSKGVECMLLQAVREYNAELKERRGE